MYRILLADDEGIMLESLKKIIESNFGNECEIHTAKSGRVVVEQAQAYPPDICFMDIQMPGISGIQAIREIQKFNSSVVFVIITAYDKFNYAKEAVNLGVMEFLTKPVNKKVILETCMKAMEKVDHTRQKRSDDLKIREKLETVVPMIESGYINNILLQDDFVTYQDNYTELLNIHQKYGYMVVVEFGDSMENGVLSNAVGAGVRANRFYSTFREIAQDFFECLVGPIMGNRIVLLVPYEENTEDYEERVAIVTRARNMVHKLENRIDSMFRCGIGRVKELGSVKESFQEAVVALRESVSHVVHIEDVPVAQKYDGEYPRDLESRYVRRILDKDAAGALNCAEGFFTWMMGQPSVSREDVEIKILELVMDAERRAFFAGTMKYNVNYRRSYIRELQSCADMNGLKNWFLDKTRDICARMEDSREKEELSIIEKARSYINENFRRDISLDDVSREVDISPYYFSKLFKQETGKNFIEYLTEIRLRSARELLQNSQYSIKEICAQSGYSDPNYFSRIFKKYEGVTPSEFREHLR
ncbi:response regulator [Blautia difficilis]|uniref:Stage 0 sporulation protein A homolog n=1 Tax=Blautia difficilis TaxID=2763027 RepID=A0ABR7IHE9_9FIRM|nr:helix-turn-helix domain-containing protein [Blautia difficilis]MBC5779456.1 response regulator [Blautia difficilis]